jgi:tRNA(Ile)-lysidine synthetase-like protein
MTTPIAERVLREMDRTDGWPPAGGSAVLAVSGGLDSMVLARWLAPWMRERGHRVLLAHVDHGWRGEEGCRDRDFVRELAAELGAEFVWTELPHDTALRRAVGREAAARAGRRRWLLFLAQEYAPARVYLAQHRDDQVETVLLRRRDGVPAARAAGMVRDSGPVRRPLLAVSRRDLRAEAQSAGWFWREDSSNEDLTIRRNSLRIKEIPELSRAVPGFERGLLAAAERASRQRRALARRADGARATVMMPPRSPGAQVLDRCALSALPSELALLLLRQALPPPKDGQRPPLRRPLELLLREVRRGPAPRSGRRFDLGAGWRARLVQDRLELSRDRAPAVDSTASELVYTGASPGTSPSARG